MRPRQRYVPLETLVVVGQAGSLLRRNRPSLLRGHAAHGNDLGTSDLGHLVGLGRRSPCDHPDAVPRLLGICSRALWDWGTRPNGR